jgi:DNA-binding CsgD family transcriptional regulator
VNPTALDIVTHAYEFHDEFSAWLAKLSTLIASRRDVDQVIARHHHSEGSEIVVGRHGLETADCALPFDIRSEEIVVDCGMLSESSANPVETADAGEYDIWHLMIALPSGRGISFVHRVQAPQPLTETERAFWTRVGHHIARALQFRVAFEHSAARSPGSDMHAARSPKLHIQRLSRRARAQEDFADAATDAARWWEELLQGKWAIIDHLQEERHSVYVAVANAELEQDPKKLTPREREIVELAATATSPKSIAFDLGLATSTVSVHLSNALRKLGLDDRYELIQLHCGIFTDLES